MTLDFAAVGAFRAADARGAASAIIGHHQPPFACNAAGRGAPGHVAWLKLMTFGRGHVPTLKYETCPGAGWIYAVVGIHLDHAANSSLAGERAAGKSQARSRSHCQIEPTNRITPSTSFRIMYIMFRPASHCELLLPQPPPCGGMCPPRSWRLRLLIEVPLTLPLLRLCWAGRRAPENAFGMPAGTR